jgi:hypothetical protein
MHQAGFEPTIPVFEQAESVHALDRGATVIGNSEYRGLSIVSVHSFCSSDSSLIWVSPYSEQLPVNLMFVFYERKNKSQSCLFLM